MLYLQKADGFVGKFGWYYRLTGSSMTNNRKAFSLEETLAAKPKALLIHVSKELDEEDKLSISKARNTTLIALHQLCKANAVTGDLDSKYDTVFATTCPDDDPGLAQIMPYIIDEISVEDAMSTWDKVVATDQVSTRLLDAIRLGAFYSARNKITNALSTASNHHQMGVSHFSPPVDIKIVNLVVMLWGVEDVVTESVTRLAPLIEHAGSASTSIYEELSTKDELAQKIAAWGKEWRAAVTAHADSFKGISGTVDANEIVEKLVGDVSSSKLAAAAGVPLSDIIA